MIETGDVDYDLDGTPLQGFLAFDAASTGGIRSTSMMFASGYRSASRGRYGRNSAADRLERLM